MNVADESGTFWKAQDDPHFLIYKNTKLSNFHQLDWYDKISSYVKKYYFSPIQIIY